MPQVRLDGMDLPDSPEGLQVPGEVRPAHGHPHAVATLGDGADDVAPEEPRAAEDGHELIDVRLSKHGVFCRLRGAFCDAKSSIRLRLLRGCRNSHLTRGGAPHT